MKFPDIAFRKGSKIYSTLVSILKENHMHERISGHGRQKVTKVKSGKGILRQAFASKQRAVDKRKEVLHDRIIVHARALEELQISYTCTEMKGSLIILIPYDVKVSDTSDDIQDEQIDEYVPVPVAITAETADIREHSSKQSSLLRNQCFDIGSAI